MTKLQEHPVIVTSTVWFGFFAAIAGAWIKNDGKVHELYDARLESEVSQIDRLEKQVVGYEDTRKANARLSVELEGMEARYAALEAQHEQWLAGNWQQRYEAEQISNRALQERLALDAERRSAETKTFNDTIAQLRQQRSDLESRLASLPVIQQKSVGEGVKALDDLLAAKKALTIKVDELEATVADQRTQLQLLGKKLEVAERRANELHALVQSNALGRTPSNASNGDEIGRIIVALDGVRIDGTAAEIAIRQLLALNRQITAEELLRVLNAADIRIDGTYCHVIQAVSARIEKPIQLETLRALVAPIAIDGVRQLAVDALNAK